MPSTRASMTLPNGVLACYGYDAAREVQSISYLQSGTCASPGTSVGNLTYAYDAAGRVVSRGGSLFTSVLPQQVTSAVYNADNQLTKRTTPGSAFNLGYDANGNLLCTGVNVQTCSGTSYTWDSRNRLTAVSDGSSYLYDGLGRREQSVLNGATRQYLYDGSNVIEDQVSGTGNPILTGPSLDERYGRANNGTWTYMLTDALGSTVALSNPTTGAVQANYAYDPYGVTTTTGSALVNPNRYTGREFDSTALYYYRGRYYTPATGRFISEDPLGFGGGDSNLYRYVGNSPAGFTDPLGLYSIACSTRCKNTWTDIAQKLVYLGGATSDLGTAAGVVGVGLTITPAAPLSVRVEAIAGYTKALAIGEGALGYVIYGVTTDNWNGAVGIGASMAAGSLLKPFNTPITPSPLMSDARSELSNGIDRYLGNPNPDCPNLRTF